MVGVQPTEAWQVGLQQFCVEAAAGQAATRTCRGCMLLLGVARWAAAVEEGLGLQQGRLSGTRSGRVCTRIRVVTTCMWQGWSMGLPYGMHSRALHVVAMGGIVHTTIVCVHVTVAMGQLIALLAGVLAGGGERSLHSIVSVV
jgi:hypothetical protein